MLRDAFPKLAIIAGNVTSAAGVEFLADCGANIIKVGQGPGSICTTRIVAGVGIPQMTALYICSRAAAKKGVTILADGGIMKSGSAARYGHAPNPTQKVAGEGIEALKEVVGPVDRVLAQLIGGIQSGMGYLGAANLEELRAKARFIRVSAAGIKEAAPHDVV